MPLFEYPKKLFQDLSHFCRSPQRIRDRFDRLDNETRNLHQDFNTLKQAHYKLVNDLSLHRHAILELMKDVQPVREFCSTFNADHRYYTVRRKSTLFFIGVPKEHPLNNSPVFAGQSAQAVYELLDQKRIDTIILRFLNEENQLNSSINIDKLISRFGDNLDLLKILIEQIIPSPTNKGSGGNSDDETITQKNFFYEVLENLKIEPDLLDFFAWGNQFRDGFIYDDEISRDFETEEVAIQRLPPPFNEPDNLRERKFAQPKKNSVLFLHHSYHHFGTMAKALRKRGWEAITVSIESPESAQRQFYTQEDINLYHDDPVTRQKNTSAFFETIPERFGSIHFYGMGQSSLYSENYDGIDHESKLPWDFLELRRHQTIIGYMPSGCLDGAPQSKIDKISNGVCGKCVWQLRPDVCRDEKSNAWASLLDNICDWIGIEGDWAVGERIGPKYVRGPIVTALDPDYWDPNTTVSESFKIAKKPSEILVFHAVGNYEERRKSGRDIKGSGAVEAAIEQLRKNGVPVKLFFATNIPISDIRYYKVQADIVIDQLNYGRLGSNARESFMLGKPVITRLIPNQQPPMVPLRSVAEAPALDASEETVADVLQNLALNVNKRAELSKRSREYALDWYGAEACAKRYEMIIERVSNGLPPETEELYPT